MTTNLKNEMPKFLNYRDAESNEELLEERVWVLKMNLVSYKRDIEKNTAKIQEFVNVGARPAAIRLSKENRDLEFKIARDEAELAKLAN
jgi:hypothetical protein